MAITMLQGEVPKELRSGSGSGSGYGCGDYGSGSGYGDGGDGYGNHPEYLAALLAVYGGERGAELVAQGATLAFWRSSRDGKPANGGSGTQAKPGLIEEIAGPLQLCTRHALHATLHPWEWEGERLWVVALYPSVESDRDKLGSLKREILAEVANIFQR